MSLVIFYVLFSSVDYVPVKGEGGGGGGRWVQLGWGGGIGRKGIQL